MRRVVIALQTFQKVIQQSHPVSDLRLVWSVVPDKRSLVDVVRHWSKAETRIRSDERLWECPLWSMLVDGNEQALHADCKKGSECDVKYCVECYEFTCKYFDVYVTIRACLAFHEAIWDGNWVGRAVWCNICWFRAKHKFMLILLRAEFVVLSGYSFEKVSRPLMAVEKSFGFSQTKMFSSWFHRVLNIITQKRVLNREKKSLVCIFRVECWISLYSVASCFTHMFGETLRQDNLKKPQPIMTIRCALTRSLRQHKTLEKASARFSLIGDVPGVWSLGCHTGKLLVFFRSLSSDSSFAFGLF